jgi:hypothetical protein
MDQSCFICSRSAETEEHIFPKWLQNKYSLWDQKIRLPNSTKISYRQLKIPCCNECNNEILSQIEKRIENGSASNQDLWRWAVKIHYGLLRKDDFLEWDRKNPGYKIGEVIRTEDPLELDRHLVHSIRGEFETHPDPFGSVFVFKFHEEEPYHFVHLMQPAGICICLGKIGYVVFINDTGTLNRQPSVQEAFYKHTKETHLGKMLNFFANSWVHLYRHKSSYPIAISKKSIAVLGAPRLIEELPFEDEMFQELWKYVTDNPDAPIVSTQEYEATNGRVSQADPRNLMILKDDED